MKLIIKDKRTNKREAHAKVKDLKEAKQFVERFGRDGRNYIFKKEIIK